MQKSTFYLRVKLYGYCKDIDNSTAVLEGDGDQLFCPARRAGHFRYFLTFSITKNDFLHFLSS